MLRALLSLLAECWAGGEAWEEEADGGGGGESRSKMYELFRRELCLPSEEDIALRGDEVAELREEYAYLAEAVHALFLQDLKYSVADVAKAFERYQANVFSVRRASHSLPTVASAVGLVASLFDHSCEPNCTFFFRPPPSGETGRVRIVVRALRPIAKGEKMTIAYTGDLYASPRERKAMMLSSHGFVCKCDACTRNEDLVGGILCPDCPRGAADGDDCVMELHAAGDASFFKCNKCTVTRPLRDVQALGGRLQRLHGNGMQLLRANKTKEGRKMLEGELLPLGNKVLASGHMLLVQTYAALLTVANMEQDRAAVVVYASALIRALESYSPALRATVSRLESRLAAGADAEDEAAASEAESKSFGLPMGDGRPLVDLEALGALYDLKGRTDASGDADKGSNEMVRLSRALLRFSRMADVELPPANE